MTHRLPLKKEVRQMMRHDNALRSQSERSTLSHAICQAVEQNEHFRHATDILLYYPLDGEVDITPLLQAYQTSKRLYLPIVHGEQLLIAPYKGITHLRQGALRVWEPITTPLDNLSSINCAILPGVAFDRQGNRLGYGRGFYDRLLPRLPNAYTIGVCFDTHLIDLLPTDENDIPVKCIVTPTEIIQRKTTANQ